MHNYLLFFATIILSGCGMMPVAGVLVNNPAPVVYIVNSNSCKNVVKKLEKKVIIKKNPGEVDYLVVFGRSLDRLVVDIIYKNKQIQEMEYTIMSGPDVDRLIARDIILLLVPRRLNHNQNYNHLQFKKSCKI